MNLNEIEDRIFRIQNNLDFQNLALDIFNYQYKNCSIYKKYCDLLKVLPNEIKKINKIPFLPIQLFKTQKIICGNFNEKIIFTSSGTSGNLTSNHYIKNINLYKKSFLTTFKMFYPNWKKHAIIGLLPSYLEREGSSLIYMVDELIKQSQNNKSKFQLDLNKEFINYLETDSAPKIIFGVTFALLKMAELRVKPKNAIILETGGMKGRGEELTRKELHEILQKALQPNAIHSEYGMTELLSQAYLQDESFNSPPWLKPLVREITDPLTSKEFGKGALNLIDLSNLHSCSFIATDDLGKVNSNGTFNVLGRIDHTQARGCNLLVL